MAQLFRPSSSEFSGTGGQAQELRKLFQHGRCIRIIARIGWDRDDIQVPALAPALFLSQVFQACLATDAVEQPCHGRKRPSMQALDDAPESSGLTNARIGMPSRDRLYACAGAASLLRAHIRKFSFDSSSVRRCPSVLRCRSMNPAQPRPKRHSY